MLIKKRPSWAMAEADATSEHIYLNRREWLCAAGFAGLGLTTALSGVGGFAAAELAVPELTVDAPPAASVSSVFLRLAVPCFSSAFCFNAIARSDQKIKETTTPRCVNKMKQCLSQLTCDPKTGLRRPINNHCVKVGSQSCQETPGHP